MGGQVDGCMGPFTDGWRFDGWPGECMDVWMGEWVVDGQMDGQTGL